MPARLRDIIRVLLEDYGLESQRPSRGSHWKIVDTATGRSYTVPAHNGPRTEIDDKYIRAMCRYFDIDYKDLKKKL